MAKMGVGGYGVRSTMSSKDLENLPDEIIKKAKKSQEKQDQQAEAVRSLYKPKIKKLKKKIESEFKKSDKIEHGNVKLYGKGQEVSKDLILIKYVIESERRKKKIFDRTLNFVQEAIRLSGLFEFFIVRNFGDQDLKGTDKVELLFLKQNHTWERIKNKPYIVEPSGEEGGGGVPGGPPSPGGGFGDAMPEEPTGAPPESEVPAEPEGGKEA